MQSKNIKKLIIFLIIILFVIIGIIVSILILNSKYNISDEEETSQQQTTTENTQVKQTIINIDKSKLKSVESEFKKVTEVNKYYTIKTLLAKYMEQQLGDNIYTYISSMYEMQKSDKFYLYYIQGHVTDKNTQQKNNMSLAILTDTTNLTFKVYTEEELENMGYTNILKQTNIEIPIENIKKSEDNTYNNIFYNEDLYAQAVLNTWIETATYDIDTSYKLINSDYKKARFNDIESFSEFLNNNTTILEAKLSKYKFTNYTTYRELICQDENENFYVFNITNPGEFTVWLDRYTVVLPSDKDDYSNAFPKDRCSFNIERFIQGINDKNYEFSYSVLANSFKISKFSTLEQFKKYCEENLFEKNEVEYLEYGMSDDNYTYTVTLTDKTDQTARTVNLKFIINLKSGTNFELSFEEQ